MSSKTLRPVEPRLAWAYVADLAAGVAADAVPRLGVARQRFVAGGDALAPAEGDGEAYLLVPVTSYAGLPRGKRPAAYCPVCLERVHLHLGTRVRHHYVHRPGAECAAGRGEGALHLAAKLHLAEQLAVGGTGLDLRPVCARVPEERSTERCAPAPVSPWTLAWDAVEVERTIPSLRADVMLLRGGEPVAAIEVCAFNAVDAVRAEKYRRLGIPWIEVPARGVISESGIGWSPGAPLAVLQESRTCPDTWRCPRHEALYRGAQEHARSGVHRMAARVVHVYRTDGGRSSGEVRVRALTVSMMERRENGGLAEAWLERDDTDGRIGFAVRTEDREEARRRLHARFTEWVRWMRDTQSAIVDSPMRWAPARAPDGWQKSGQFPSRLRWDAHQGAFVAVPNLPAVSWPRLPRVDSLVADSVLGYDGCVWTQLQPGKPPVVHAVAGAVWVTLRVQPFRAADGAEMATGHLAAFVHDGGRWRTCAGAPYVATGAVPPGGRIAWERIAESTVRELSARDPQSLFDGESAGAVFASVVEGQISAG